MKYMSYNSTSNISEYTVGTAYAFYVHKNSVIRMDKADHDTIKKYAPVIAAVVRDNNECTATDGQWLAFIRVFGVVVDKKEAISDNDIDRITVMFKTTDDNYVLDKYAVGIHDVFTNGKDIVLPAAVLSV